MPSKRTISTALLGVALGAACSRPDHFASQPSSSAGSAGASFSGAASSAGTGGTGGVASAGASGAGGISSNAGSGGSAGSAAEPVGPTPAVPGTNFPFPQNRPSARCTYPSYRNSDVRQAYERWKRETVTEAGAGGHLRVKRLAGDTGLEAGSTVSEGIAYGMLLAVYMADQPVFDALWKYSQLWTNGNGLMDWYIDAAGTTALGTGAASDADEDIAWALIMADRQWGGAGSLSASYLDLAKAQIDRLWQHEIHEGKLMMPGDSWGVEDPWTIVNPSYFAPSYYRTFAEVTGNLGWNDVVTTTYDTLENSLNAANGNAQNGLVPAWCTSEGTPNPNVFEGNPTHYQYDSCRTPFRIGLDYCQHGEPRAKAYVEKTSQFFAGLGVANIVDGYELNGTPRPSHTTGQSATFVGPALVGAMNDPARLAFIQEGYGKVAAYDLLVGGEYYDGSWTVLTLLMLSGNFLDYTRETPLEP